MTITWQHLLKSCDVISDILQIFVSVIRNQKISLTNHIIIYFYFMTNNYAVTSLRHCNITMSL
jgi:hypothetical protein